METQPHRINLSEQVKFKVFRESRIFRFLAPEETDAFASQMTAFRLPKGALIFAEGNSSDFFYVVQEGFVRLYKTAPSGKTLTFTIAGHGETLNGLALSLDKYFLSAQTMSIVNVLRMSRKEFLAFLESHPRFGFDLISIIARRIEIDYARTVDFVGEDVEQRLFYALYSLASKFGTTLSLTREDLGNFAGTTTETTIRVLSGLRKSGILSCHANRGEVIISDLGKLMERLKVPPGLT